MFKSKLLELCQRRKWPMPDFTIDRQGMPHNPRFTAQVTVNGHTFHSHHLSLSTKEAQAKASEIAYLALIDVPSETADSDPVRNAMDCKIPFKTQLQSYAQKKRKDLPIYGYRHVGPAHAPGFMATVNYDGQTFESDQYYNTVREAEQAAARIALMSLPMEETQQDDIISYKACLQELAQKENLTLPNYCTTIRGDCHMPIFSSVVEIKGEFFEGDPAKTKKQAESNAAKVAWNQLTACKVKSNPDTASVSEVEKPMAVAVNFEGNMKSRKPPSTEQKTFSPNEGIIKSTTTLNDNIYFHEDNRSDGSVVQMSLPKEEIQQDDSVQYKSLLQELAQKEKVLMPKYSTISAGSDHMTIFSSVVEIKGEIFEGEPAKTKKQSEINAAKAAWVKLNEDKLRYSPCTASASVIMKKPIEVEFNDEEKTKFSRHTSKLIMNTPNEKQAHLSHNDHSAASANVDHGLKVDDNATSFHLDHATSAGCEYNIPSVGVSSLSMNSVLPHTTHPVSASSLTINSALPNSTSLPSPNVGATLGGNRVCVYPRKTGMTLPEGATVLPMSDDEWVAVLFA